MNWYNDIYKAAVTYDFFRGVRQEGGDIFAVVQDGWSGRVKPYSLEELEKKLNGIIAQLREGVDAFQTKKLNHDVKEYANALKDLKRALQGQEVVLRQ